MDDLIFRRGQRDGAVGMAKFYLVRDDLALGVAPHKFEAAVRVECRTNVESFLGTEVPRAAGGRLSMDEHATTNRSKRSLVEVKQSLEVLPHGDPWVECRLLEEIEGKFRLGKEEVPKVLGKGWIHTGQDGNEVGFESSDDLLGPVATMHIRRDQLKLGLPGDGDGLFVGCTGLIVQDLELDRETPCR
jgi:hypothetical protein